MKVNLIGFELVLPKNISIGELFQQLENVQKKEHRIHNRKLILLANVVCGYICGVFLVYKSHKKSLATQVDENGDLVVNKTTLSPGEYGTEVSLFCVNPDTRKGLMYNYSGSASPSGVQQFFRAQSNNIKRSKIKNYKDEITHFGTKKIEKAHEKALKEFEGDFHLKLLVTPADLNSLVDRYREIHQVVLRSEEALNDAGIFTPLETVSSKACLSVDFDKEVPGKDLRKLVKTVFSRFVGSGKEKALRLYGLSHSGEELNLKVGENLDSFGKIEYDDYVELLPKEKWKEFICCDALGKLLDECRGSTSVFGNAPDPHLSWKLVSASDLSKEALRAGGENALSNVVL